MQGGHIKFSLYSVAIADVFTNQLFQCAQIYNEPLGLAKTSQAQGELDSRARSGQVQDERGASVSSINTVNHWRIGRGHLWLYGYKSS